LDFNPNVAFTFTPAANWRDSTAIKQAMVMEADERAWSPSMAAASDVPTVTNVPKVGPRM